MLSEGPSGPPPGLGGMVRAPMLPFYSATSDVFVISDLYIQPPSALITEGPQGSGTAAAAEQQTSLANKTNIPRPVRPNLGSAGMRVSVKEAALSSRAAPSRTTPPRKPISEYIKDKKDGAIVFPGLAAAQQTAQSFLINDDLDETMADDPADPHLSTVE